MNDKIPITIGINIDMFNFSHSNHNITSSSIIYLIVNYMTNYSYIIYTTTIYYSHAIYIKPYRKKGEILW